VDKQRLAELAAETKQIVEQGYYNIRLEDVDLRVQVQNHDGPTSSLIHPEDWEDIEKVASTRAPAHTRQPSISVEADTTLHAAMTISYTEDCPLPVLSCGGCMVLNFASARNPGGGWLRGTDAQEESLARASDLVASLERWPRYYRANREGNTLYTDHAIWSPNVAFFRDDRGRLLAHPDYSNVLTMPAPNLSARDGGTGLSKTDVAAVLRRRINYILAAAAFYHQHFLVLGAWGCGVFDNDPRQVAELFRDSLRRWGGYFQRVVFAIHDTSKDQKVLSQFQEIFK
jgi:uncharacterized protein (TIGR02452 family)